MIKCPNCQNEIANKDFRNIRMSTRCGKCEKYLSIRPSLIFLFIALLLFGVLWDFTPFLYTLPGGWTLRYFLTLAFAVLLLAVQVTVGFGKVQIIKPRETSK